MSPSPLLRARAGLTGAVAALALLLPERDLPAQTELPTVQVAQMPGAANVGFGGTARLRLDRDAFLVVLEIGADHRARILHPALPKDGAWTRSDRSVFVPLPSADAAFIRSAELRVPEIVAFVSDVEPNLEEFTERGRRWDYQYIVSPDEPLELTVRSLATLLYGDPDMPYSVVTRREYPVLNRATFASLSRCGYNLNAPYSPAFNTFLWQAFGPVSLLETSWAIDDRYRNFQWEGRYWFLASLSPLGVFHRSVGAGLWDTFGDPCDALRAQRLFYLNGWNTRTVARGPLPPGTTPEVVPVPGDRNPEARPPVVPGVDIVPVAPEEMQRRAGAVTRLADARAETRAAARGPLTRESNEELVKRQEIATVMALLASQRQGGRGSLDVMDVFQRVRSGQTLVADADGRLRSAPRGTRTAGRIGSGSSGSGGFGGSGSVSSGAGGGFGGGGSGGGASVGSGSSSGGGEARGGGGERGGSSGRGSGTGRP